MSRRAFLDAAAALPAPQAATRRPNILFIMADEMRRDAMGCAGHPEVRTPTLDRPAREGVRFSRCYTAAPVCPLARASAFTGRCTNVHGVTSSEIPAYRGEIFLPSILKHHGYHTAIAGKLHYIPCRFSYGSDEFYSFRPGRPHAAARLQPVPADEARLSGQLAHRGRDLSLARRSAGSRRGSVQVPRTTPRSPKRTARRPSVRPLITWSGGIVAPAKAALRDSGL